MTKAHFVRHSPCPKCGSRDNLGLYSDGSAFCFGCGFVKRANNFAWLSNKEIDDINGNRLKFPNVGLLNGVTTDWLSQFGIGVAEAIRRDVGTDERNRTCFAFKADGETILVQARNHFRKDKKSPKYITYGKPDECIPM